MRHILVPIDFSEAAQAALEAAVAICKDLREKITLLHVVHTEKLTEALMGLDAVEYLSQVLELPPNKSGCAPSFSAVPLESIARRKLTECVDPRWRDRITIETAFAEGRPSSRIVEYARDHNVDMIVMGTHGRGPVGRFFLGSVADNVVRSAHCPVLTDRGKSGQAAKP